MDFLYDESGNAYSFVYNGTQYYYVRNLQGDVVKILNTSGGVVAGSPGGEFHVEWGKTFTIPGTEFNIFDVSESIYRKIMEW